MLLMAIFAPWAVGQTREIVYQKVTETQTDWSGNYLLVYTSSSRAATASISYNMLNSTNVTISNSEIANIGSATIITLEDKGNNKYAIKIGDSYLKRTKATETKLTLASSYDDSDLYRWTLSYSNGIVIKSASTNQSAYFYFHTSYNQFGLQSSSSTVDLYKEATGSDYPAPLNLGYTVESHQATLTWESPSENLTGYAYQYKKSSEESWSELVQVESNVLSCTIGNLDASTSYDFKVKDRAGNLLALDGKTKTLPASNKLVFDSTTPTTKTRDIVAPAATIKATSRVTHRNADGRDLFNHAVTLNVTITDPGSDVYSSGLKDVSYDVYVDGKKVKGDSASYGINGASDAINETTADVKDDKLTYTKKFTINLPTSYQSNDIEIRVNATDHSGNKMGTVKYRCGIDTVGPKITVSYDNNSAQNEKYFKADRTATIKVVDRNVDNGKIHINTQVSVPGSFSYSSGGGNGANDTWIKKLYYNKDGDYTLDLPNCTDALGNKASVTYQGTAPKAFTIDKTIPVIYVTFDNNSSQNGKYYKDPRTATVRIHEHNFRASDVKINQTATIQKGSVSAPGVSGFGGGGDDHSASINYSNDGNYTIEVNYTDLAGNPAKVVKVDEFVIDRTKPVVKFVTPNKNNMVFQDAIAPQIEYSDINTTRGMASISLKGMKKSNVLEVVEDTFSDYQGTVRFENLKKVRENDDIYLATAVVTDLAGNEESVSITFSVNRFGSTYDYNNDPFTTDLVQNYFANEEGDVVLREINVNKLTERSLTLYKDGDNRKLVEGTDFKVDENTVNGHYEYIYTIFKANFEEEGNYNIIATSKDEAKNTNSNSSVKGNDGSNEVPLRFAIDKTEPTNEVTGVDITKNKFTESEITLDIRPLDNMNAIASFLVRVLNKEGEEKFKFYIYGEELAKYFEEHDGVYQLIIKQNTGWQTIEIVTTDAAGNQSTDYTIDDYTAYNVLVTPNLLYNYINPLLLVGALIMGVGGLVFLIFWRWRRRR